MLRNKTKEMTTNPLNNYEELAEQLRDFLLDYSWLFNFSNINIIIDDFIGKVNITLLRNHIEVVTIEFTLTFNV